MAVRTKTTCHDKKATHLSLSKKMLTRSFPFASSGFCLHDSSQTRVTMFSASSSATSGVNSSFGRVAKYSLILASACSEDTISKHESFA